MAEKDQVIAVLRATLLSCKGSLTLKQCNRDFKELQGEWIPFKKLGYDSLEKLFLDIQGFRVSEQNGEWRVDAIASQETKHIASMVARQKSASRSKTAPRLSYQNRFPKKPDPWRKPSSSDNHSSYGQRFYKQSYTPRGIPFNNNSYQQIKASYTPRDTYQKTEYKVNETKETTKEIKKSSPEQPAKADNNRKTLPVEVKPTKKATGSTASVTARLQACAEAAQLNNRHIEKLPPQVERKKDEREKKPVQKRSASQRLSNLRDHLHTVDLIPLHLPANANDCIEISSTQQTHELIAEPKEEVEALVPPPDSASPQEKLIWTCRRLGLPEPLYKVHENRPKRGPVSYDCNVKVGGAYTASSYPDSAPTEQQARSLAALKVLTAVESSEAPGLPTASSTTAVARLADLVAEHEAGVWASTVPHLYRDKYTENLPANWQELVDGCPRILMDRLANGLLVLLPKTEAEALAYSEDDRLDEMDEELPELQFPEENFWNVYVTVANSTLEVWLRIIGEKYSDAYEVLLPEMETYYMTSGTPITTVVVNAWYAVRLEEGGWQRAKVLEIEGAHAAVFLGDHGDDELVPIADMRVLEPQFRTLPPQAVLCRLEGAEEMVGLDLGAKVVRHRLVGEVLVAEPTSFRDPHDPAISVVLYDTSTHRDLNLNKEIVQDFCTAGNLKITRRPCEVEVGCVSEEGRVWVSPAGGAMFVRNALALLTSPGPYRRPLPNSPQAPSPTPGTLYIVRTLKGDWVRCIIRSGLDSTGSVLTRLVDSGERMLAPLSSLVPLQHFSPALNAYPMQAVSVRLGPAEHAAGSMVQRLRQLLLGERVLCRAIPSVGAAHSADTPPQVELFVRKLPDNLLVSVNSSILMEFDYQQLNKHKGEETPKTDPVEAFHRKKERIFSRTTSAMGITKGGPNSELPLPTGSCPELPPPLLPAVGDCFDVYVAMAANPWNFMVQPNGTRTKLLALMAALQKECPKLLASDAPVKPATGELYTVYYDKYDSWYRVVVAGMVSSETVSVYFCDYGDLSVFSASELRKVPTEVSLARTLPPQAIKARLHNILPLHQDWTVEDCMKFKELCEEQMFVGLCKEVGRDPLNTCEPLLTLELIDTSTDDDIYLNQQLVAEGRARLCPTP